MFGRKRILRVLVVLAIAMATGHIVETLRGARPAEAAFVDRTVGAALPDLAGITSVSAAVDGPPDPCAPRLDLTPAPGAMLNVALLAPCHVGERVLLRHSGLSFTTQVGLDGAVRLDLPALAETSLVAAYFEGSGVVLQSVVVPDAARYTRFAFQAAHPLQFDLRVTDAGRVYSGKGAGDATGPIVTLGTTAVREPLLAQVYTSSGPDFAAVDLTVELRITPETCSRTFMAETLTVERGIAVQSNLPITVPLCGSAGDILVLKNLVGATTLLVPE